MMLPLSYQLSFSRGWVTFPALVFVVASVASHLNVATASEACINAYSNFDLMAGQLCDSSGLSLAQLMTETCPSDCQALYDSVLAKCTVGDRYVSSLSFDFAEDTLFGVEGHKWATCDYGYNFTTCQRSYRILKENSACSEFGSTKEELATGPCPEACQDDLNSMIASCEPNVGIYLTESATFGIAWLAVYREGILWSDYGQREQCDFGYQPTSCDVALESLSQDVIGINTLLFGPNNTVCKRDDNENACTAKCITLIDDFLSGCPVGAEFAPTGGYLSRTNQRIPFEGPKTLDAYGLNPETATLESFSLSQPCWDYLKARLPLQSAFDNGTGSAAGSPPVEPTPAPPTSPAAPTLPLPSVASSAPARLSTGVFVIIASSGWILICYVLAAAFA